jgi:hypothetical protein
MEFQPPRPYNMMGCIPNPHFRHDGLADTESYLQPKPNRRHDELENTLLPHDQYPIQGMMG